MNVRQTLAEMGLSLPPPPAPRGGYVPAVQTGNLLFVSGMLPIQDGKVAFTGKVGAGVSIEEGKNAARLAALNALAVIENHLSDFNRLKRIVKVTGYVNSARWFVSQPQVVDGASELFVRLFGEAGKHARAAVGVAELPAGAAVEIEVICEVE